MRFLITRFIFHIKSYQVRFLVGVTCLLFIFDHFLYAQAPGYQIKGQLINYQQDTIFLGYYYGDKQYLVDTAKVVEGTFTFEGSDTLRPGVYLIVMPPDNKFFQIMINEGEKKFSFHADIQALESSIRFEHSLDNELFYRNLNFIAAKRKELEQINAQKDSAATEEAKAIQEQNLKELNESVVDFQKKLVESNPTTLTAALIRSGFQIEIPTYEGTAEEIQNKQYFYYKKHYFDYVDLSDDRFIRCPAHVMYDKVNYYLQKLTVQHPDSLIVSIDYLLGKMEGAPETYKNFLVKFLNEYAQSKIVGMDAVYVHLALNYYRKGKAPWLEQTQLNKIVENALDAEPTLIGKIASDLRLQDRDSSGIRLYDIRSPYLILVFWAHDCAHCKESMPKLKEFYDQHAKEYGIEVLSVCTKLNKDEPPCWQFVDEKKLDGWINASDKTGGRSYMHSLFNVKKTPKLYILDHQKKIISKDLGPEQLLDFFKHYTASQNSSD